MAILLFEIGRLRCLFIIATLFTLQSSEIKEIVIFFLTT